ncbi:MAG TPA: methyltransferase domain-containing protein [Deltaproteobacteria bacterium]|nr:methyltransferase domain-containing protein [Deltaproteobacteria bacterium]
MADEAIEEALKSGEKLFSRRQIDEAETVFQTILEQVPGHSEALNNMGVIWYTRGDNEKAEKLFSRALDANRDNLEALSNLAELYRSAGRQDKEIECLKKIVVLNSDDYITSSRLALLYVETGEPAKALPHLNASIDLLSAQRPETNDARQLANPNTPEKDLVRGNIKGQSTLDRQTLRHFRDKKFNEIIKTIQSRVQDRLYEDVEAICKHWLVFVSTSTGYIFYFLGLAANGLQEFDKALAYHKRALELDPALADLRNRQSKYRYTYEESPTHCIGCENDGFETVNVLNQSIAEDNKELINPVRQWVRCFRCGLIFANPIPNEEALNRYYSRIAGEKFGGIYGNIEERLDFLADMSRTRLEKIERHGNGAATILDIGAGIGIFTKTALDRGWQAEGIELTPEDCDYAKEKFGLELKQENFYDLSENRKYDVVTLFEVIEHLRHPLKDLKYINTLIHDNGLLVLATPILDSAYGNETKEHNPFWYVVSHLSYFTRNVMINYLREAGFEIVEICDSPEGMGRMEFYCRKST